MAASPPHTPEPLLSEEEYKTELDLISNEVFGAIYIFHVMEEINELALHNPHVFAAINEQPLFWQSHRNANQTALFMYLGRIFDIDGNTLSIHRLLRITMLNFQVFSRAALTGRKMGRETEPPWWLDEFMQDTWQPQEPADLKFLKKALKPHTAMFEAVYKPIRHSIYGHRIMSDEEAGVALFPQTNRVALGKILDFLHALTDSLSNLYLNGTKPNLDMDFTEHNIHIREDARRVMQKLAKDVRVDKS